jgi:translation elongation factor EF-Ts
LELVDFKRWERGEGIEKLKRKFSREVMNQA